jgi:hypothetical protein
VAGAGAENVRSNEQPRSFYSARIEPVAQVNRRPVWIDTAEVAQRGEAILHVLAGDLQPDQRLGSGRLKRLEGEVPGVHREVHMGVDEPGTHCALGEVDQAGSEWSLD